jgi:hypothetical protein
MKFRHAALGFALLACLTGCAPKARSFSNPRVANNSFKPLDQVAPCCHDMVLGRISLDQCMEKPECKANGRQCCMNAIK